MDKRPHALPPSASRSSPSICESETLALNENTGLFSADRARRRMACQSPLWDPRRPSIASGGTSGTCHEQTFARFYVSDKHVDCDLSQTKIKLTELGG
jgi:hypothetical protein